MPNADTVGGDFDFFGCFPDDSTSLLIASAGLWLTRANSRSYNLLRLVGDFGPGCRQSVCDIYH